MPTTCQYQPPYTDLYIYYIQGRINGCPDLGGDAFIGNWEEEGDSFLFFKRAADERVQQLLTQQPHLVLQDQYQMSYEQWQGGATATLDAGSLRVIAPWSPQAAQPRDHDILLDPGVVFGTGTHPTTHDCLIAMQMAFAAQPIRTVVDLGTGTGLLALAAAHLGAQQVLALDLNYLAVQTAKRNIVTNGMTRQILAIQGNAMNFMDISSDLMVSNIHYEVMRHLIADEGFASKRQFILSGLLRTQAREVEYQLRQLPVKIIHRWERDGTWYTFYGCCTRPDICNKEQP